MQFLKTLFLALLIAGPALAAQAQTKTKVKTQGAAATEQVQLKTSAVCDMCKARLEKALAYEKGVQEAHLDVASQVLTVSYRPDKTSPTALRTAVQRTGYDADSQPAEPRAYDRLPDCCKKTNAVHGEGAK
jgi:copper chaperone CopZ